MDLWPRTEHQRPVQCPGQGWRANATIGRAVRLIMVNIGGGEPGVLDRATMGQPGKYSYCLAENEAENPWMPLHVEKRFPQRGQHGHRFWRGGAPQYQRSPEHISPGYSENDSPHHRCTRCNNAVTGGNSFSFWPGTCRHHLPGMVFRRRMSKSFFMRKPAFRWSISRGGFGSGSLK